MSFFETKEQYLRRVCEGDYPMCWEIMEPAYVPWWASVAPLGATALLVGLALYWMWRAQRWGRAEDALLRAAKDVEYAIRVWDVDRSQEAEAHLLLAHKQLCEMLGRA